MKTTKKSNINSTMKTIMKLAVVLLLLGISSGVYADDGKVYYSWNQGNWHDMDTWSYNDEEFQAVNELPSDKDEVFIIETVTITAESFQNGNKVEAKSVHLNGPLTIGGGVPKFGELIGSSTITLTGDYYPDVTGQDNFTGQLALEGTFEMTRVKNIYNNLIFNIQNGTVTFNNANMKIGTLRVTNGGAVISSNIEILEDLFVNSGRSITSTATITSYGNVENSGTATLNGDFKFASTDRNQNFILKGVTSFGKKIIVDKGTTDYYADFLAENTGMISLADNAIKLQSGTLMIGSNITIAKLSTTDFTIPQNAELKVVGGEVNTQNNIIVQGALTVESGELIVEQLSSQSVRGIVLNGGSLVINGGDVSVGQLIDDNNNPGAFHISAGSLTFENASGPAVFTLNNSNTIYQTSGGTITFKGKDFAIHYTDPIVTGGNFIFDHGDHNPSFQYTPPFYSLTVLGKGQITNTSGKALVVYGDLEMGASSQFYNSEKDIYLGGNLNISSTCSKFDGFGSFIFNTDKDTKLNLEKTISFSNFVVDKQNSKSVILTSNITIPQNKELKIIQGTLNVGEYTLNFEGKDVINNGSIIGKLDLKESEKTLAGIGHYDQVYQNNRNGVTLKSDIQVNDYYFPNEGNQIYCNLNSYVITIDKNYHNVDDTRCFNNNTNVVSSGLRLRVKANAGTAADNVLAFYPISCGGDAQKYAPVTIKTVKALEKAVDEYVTFNVVNKYHPCITSDRLDMYWVAKAGNNTDNKGCFQYHFKYNLNQNNNRSNYQNLALIGINWVQSTNPVNVTAFNSVDFCNSEYSLPSGDFTSGLKSQADAMKVFYTSKPDSWSGKTRDGIYATSEFFKEDGSSWGNTKPKQSDIIYIVGNDKLYLSSFTIGKIIFKHFDNQTSLGRLYLEDNKVVAGTVSGIGMVEFYHYYTNNIPGIQADLSAFDKEDDSMYDFAPKEKGNITINFNHTGELPNVQFEQADGDFDTYFQWQTELKVRNKITINCSQLYVVNNIECRTLEIGGWYNADVVFRDNNATLTVDNIKFSTASCNIKMSTLTQNHQPKLIVNENINGNNQSSCSINLYSGNSFVPLEFGGDKNSTFENHSNLTVNLGQIIVNKESINNTVTINKAITFSGTQDNAASNNKTFLLKQGELIFDYNNTSGYNLSTGGGDFVIPAAAKLTAKASGVKLNVTNCNTGITLGGALELQSGTILNNSGHLYYKETSKAKLIVLEGATFINKGQFCPDPASNGVIVLSISQNASVKIGGAECGIDTRRGIFDITDGSRIIMEAGAEIHLVDGVHNDGVADVNINAANGDCTFGDGSKLVFDGEYTKTITNIKQVTKTKTINKVNTIGSSNRDPFYDHLPTSLSECAEAIKNDYLDNNSNWKLDSKGNNSNKYYQITYNPNRNVFTYTVETVTTSSVTVSPTFTLASNTSLPNVEITDEASVTLLTVPLTVLQNLNLEGTLDANGKDMNLYGNFTNNGIFTANQNTVNFIGTADQKANGNHVITFYNANITNTKGVEFTQADVITNELSIQNDAKLYDKGTSLPITVETKYTNNNGYYIGDGGIKLCSGEQDHLIWVYSTGHTRGLIVDNTTGVKVTNQNGENLNIDSALFINSGVLNMSATTLVLGEKLKTVETTASNNTDPLKQFDKTRMIIFESTDGCGVKKLFSGNGVENVVLPIGVSGRYAPANVVINSITAGASFTITPVGTYHPTIAEYTDHPTWLTAGPKQNALNFYWNVVSQGVENFDGSLIFVNDENDYHAVNKPHNPILEGEHPSHYIPARLLAGTNAKWDKLYWEDDTYDRGVITFINHDGDENSVPFEMKNDATITGDYTAGLCDELAAGAIPGCVDVFVSVDNGNWNTPATWNTVKVEDGPIKLDADGNVEPTGEVGVPTPCSIVYVYHNVTVDINGLKNYRTIVGKRSDLTLSGKVELETTKSHSFGVVSGTGTIVTKSGTLPRGKYADFVKPNTGTIEFSGDHVNYNISRSTYNNVIFSGTGERVLPSDALVVNGNLTAEGGDNTMVVNNKEGATWNIHGDFIYNKGKFIALEGGLVSTIRMCGDKCQTFKSTCTDEGFVPPSLRINILEIDNSSHDGVIVHLPIDIIERVKFDQGVLNTFEEYRFAIDNFSENTSETVVGYTTSAFINGPLSKRILNKSSWTFPVGNHYNNSEKANNRLGEFTVYNYQPEATGSGYVKVRYYYKKHDESDKLANYGSGIEIVDQTEYWTVEPADNATFGLKIRWDEKSNIGNTESALANVCITNFNFANNKWEKLKSSAHSVGGTQRGIVTSVESNRHHYARVNNAPDYKPYVYTLAQTNAVTFDWKGSVSSDWFTAGNWSGGHVPSDGDFVVVGTIGANCHYPIINNSNEIAEAGYLKLSNNSTLTIESRNKLTVFGGVMVDEGCNLVLKAATTSIDPDDDPAAYGNHSIEPTGSLVYYGDFTGKVTFQRFVRDYEWERLCVPVTNYNGNVLLSDARIRRYVEDINLQETNGNFYEYAQDEGESENPDILADAWDIMNAPDVKNIDQAYLYLYRRKGRGHVLTFNGLPMSNGSEDHVVKVNFTGNDEIRGTDPLTGKAVKDLHGLDGWNFIANPFISSVNVDELIFKNVDNTVYIHDNIRERSFAYNVGSKESIGAYDRDNYWPNYIAAGQSFFVHATPVADNFNGSVTFTKNSRSHGDDHTLIKGMKQNNNVEKIVFNTLGNGELFQSVVYFDADATIGFDSKFDAYLQESLEANILNFYSFGNNTFEPLAANGLPSSIKNGGEIQLGYSTQTAGTYTLAVKKLTVEGTNVYLQDTEKGTIVPLSAGFACQIDVEKGTNNRRFKLIFKPNTAPVANTQLVDVKLLAGEELIYAVGTDIFEDNDLCDYVASVDISANGSLLPSWLTYDYETGTFTGTPSINDLGVSEITLTATDTHGAKTSLSFKIEVYSPIIEEPIVEDPIVEDPIIEDPIIEDPIIEEPIIEDPIIEDPIIEEPIVIDPIIEEPIVEQPIVEEPIIEEPIVEQPIVEEPIVEQPVVEQPIVEQPEVVTPEVQIPEVEDEVVIVPEVVIPEDEIGDEGTEEILVPEVVEPEPIAVVPERESFVESNEVLVFPVPSNGIVNVKLGSMLNETGSVDLTLVSASGRLVLKRTVYDSELEIDLTGHPGIYILRLSTPSATVVKRILIQ